MTRMTGPDCAVMCNLINIHTYIPGTYYIELHTYDIGSSLATIDPDWGMLRRSRYYAFRFFFKQVARIRIFRAFGLQMSCRLSMVLRLFCFVLFSFFCFY